MRRPLSEALTTVSIKRMFASARLTEEEMQDAGIKKRDTYGQSAQASSRPLGRCGTSALFCDKFRIRVGDVARLIEAPLR